MLTEEDGSIRGGTSNQIVDWMIDNAMIENESTNTEGDDTIPLTKIFFYTVPQLISPREIWTIMEKKITVKDKANVKKFVSSWMKDEFHRDFMAFGGAAIKNSTGSLSGNSRSGTDGIGNNRRESDESGDNRSGASEIARKRRKKVIRIRPLYCSLLQFIETLDPDDIMKFKLEILKCVNLPLRFRRILLPKRETPIALAASSNASVGSSTITTVGTNIQKGLEEGIPVTPVNTCSPQPSQPSDQIPDRPMSLRGDGEFGFNDIDPMDIVQQLTLIEFAVFRRIQDSELFKMAWKETKRKKAPNVQVMINRFNKMSFWVATEIVMRSDLKQRVNTLKRFIIIAEQLRTIGNFNGLMEIIAGLNMYAIQRLKQTWEQIPARLVSILEELNALMDNKQNYREYRNALKNARPPMMPYLGVCLRDIVFIEEGNPDYLNNENTLINFEKMKMLGEVFFQVKRCQTVKFSFERDPILQDYLRTIDSLTEESLYKQSLMCEPSVNAGGSTNNSNNNSPISSQNNSPRDISILERKDTQ